MAAHRTASSGLLERGRELRILGEALDSLAADGPAAGIAERLLVFTGAAGLGKTSMVAEVQTQAEQRGLLVLSSRGGEQEQRSAFHVVRSLLRPLLAQVDAEGQRALLGSWYEIVAGAVGLGTEGDSGSAPPDPQGVRDGLDWVVTNLAVSRGPLVLTLDDAHWADAESLAWLASFAARVEGLPLLLVFAYRPNEMPAGAEAFVALPGRSGVSPLGLSALTPEAVGELVRTMYRSEPGEQPAAEVAAADPAGGPVVEDAFCREAWAVTGGNPFETVELVAKARELGLPPDGTACPRLRELASASKGSGLVARLERLGTRAVRLAWSVAILGIQTPLELAAALAGLTRSEAVEAAGQLRAARILTGSQILEFVHPLIATTVYRGIAEELRTELHEQAGWAVLNAGLGPIAAARHWLEVPPRGNAAVVEQLRFAARQFMNAGAPESAQRCLSRAVEEPPPLDQRAWVLFELGHSTLLYDPAATVGHLRAALDQPGLPLELRENIAVWLAQSLSHSNHLKEGAEVVAAAAETAGSAAAWLRFQVWNLMWCAFDADEEGSPARSARLAELARRVEDDIAGTAVGSVAGTGDSVAGRYVLGLRAWDAVVRGEPKETVLHYADLALDGGLSWTDPEWAFEVPVLAALTYMYCDRVDRYEALFAKGIAEFEDAGWRGAHLAFGHTILGYARYRTGNLAEAEESARLGLDIANRVGPGLPVHWFAVGTLITILVARGGADEAAALARRYDFHAPYSAAVVFPDSPTVLGGLLYALGDQAGAVREFTAAGARLDAREMRNPGWCGWQQGLASAHAAEGRLDTARAVAAEALLRAEGFGTDSAVGTALRCSAELAEGEARVDLLTRAVERLERCSAPYELSRAALDLGRALGAAGRAEEAEAQLGRAAELAAACAADVVADEARRELAELLASG